MLLVSDVMIREVVCVSPFASLREALTLMKRHKVKSLVVERHSAHDAWGLITHTDIVKTVIAEEGDIDLLNVYDVCAKPALAVGESLDIKYVAKLMTDHRIKRLLVLRDNELLGFVSMDDIMGSVLDKIE